MKKAQRVKLKPIEGQQQTTDSEVFWSRVGESLAYIILGFVFYAFLVIPVAPATKIIMWLLSNLGIGSSLTWGQAFSGAALVSIAGFTWLVVRILRRF